MHHGPAWLGIGAQRSGTTWLTDLLVQHPGVGLGTNGRKEQQALQKVARGVLDERDYAALFPADGLHRGDFTPRYLNNAAVPAVAERLLPPHAPVVAILRDPVERLASALRRRTKLRNPWPYEAAFAYAQWSGMYAQQLAVWERAVGRDRMVVLTYEAVREDPATGCRAIWSRLGLPPVDLANAARPSSSSAGDVTWRWPDGARESLVTLYERQLDELEQRWAVRTDLWPSFTTAAVA